MSKGNIWNHHGQWAPRIDTINCLQINNNRLFNCYCRLPIYLYFFSNGLFPITFLPFEMSLYLLPNSSQSWPSLSFNSNCLLIYPYISIFQGPILRPSSVHVHPTKAIDVQLILTFSFRSLLITSILFLLTLLYVYWYIKTV